MLQHSGMLGPLEVLLTQYLAVQQLKDSEENIFNCDYAVEITSIACYHKLQILTDIVKLHL